MQSLIQNDYVFIPSNDAMYILVAIFQFISTQSLPQNGYVFTSSKGTIKNMTIPSQTRYLAYLTKILLHKESPKQNPLLIQRVILHQIPVFERNTQRFIVHKKASDQHSENETNSEDPKQSLSPSLLDMAEDPQSNGHSTLPIKPQSV